jgi:hypothetical protein
MDGRERVLLEPIQVGNLERDGHSLDRVVGGIDSGETARSDSALNPVLAEHLPGPQGLTRGRASFASEYVPAHLTKAESDIAPLPTHVVFPLR